MKLQTILVVTLLSTLALSSQGKILKSLLKKKLSLISSLGGKQNGGTSTFGFITQPQVTRPTAIQTQNNALGEITPLSETIVQPDLFDESSFVEQVHPIPASVAAVYSYNPSEYQTPTVYYRESPQPIIRRTVYEYVEAPRNNLRTLPGINNIPGISSIAGVKSLFSNALGLSSASGARPGATASATTYISYPPY